jgi:hypothetical protein
VGHEGFFDGMWVKLAIDPAGDRGLIWLDNRGDEVRDARYEVIDHLMPHLLPDRDVLAGASGEDGAASVAGVYHRIGSPDLHVEADGADLVLTHDGRCRRLAPFGRGIWRARATSADVGPWRPHAGSSHVCLGVAPPDPDGIRVVHLNALPHSRNNVCMD